jgi:enamine deaminase RidA (YjgF/YER057c/UK114 family)
MDTQAISVAELPPNNDTYSQAVRLGDLIFVSGQLGVCPEGGLADEFSGICRQNGIIIETGVGADVSSATHSGSPGPGLAKKD